MAETTFAELFGGYITFTDTKLMSGKVNSCNIDSETRTLTHSGYIYRTENDF